MDKRQERDKRFQGPFRDVLLYEGEESEGENKWGGGVGGWGVGGGDKRGRGGERGGGQEQGRHEFINAPVPVPKRSVMNS